MARMTKWWVLVLLVCAVVLTAGAVAFASPARFYAGFDVIMGTYGADELRGGPEDDLIASEGPWGGTSEDTAVDTISAGAGNDAIDTVSDPASKDVARCGPGYDEVQADPKDNLADDCEKVEIVDLSRGPEPPAGTPKYLPARGEAPPIDR